VVTGHRADEEWPPEASPMSSRLRVVTRQALGTLWILAVPVLALSSVLGTRRELATASADGIEVQVSYAGRIRYSQSHPLEVAVTNTSDRILDTITIAFDTAFVNRFSEIEFLPRSERPYEIRINAVGPGESRLVVARLRGEKYGRHRGEITIHAGGRDSARVRIDTLVLP